MPRVAYVEKANAAPEVQKIYEGFESQFGIAVPNVVKALSNSPGLASKVFPLANYFMNQSKLDEPKKDQGIVTLSGAHLGPPRRANCFRPARAAPRRPGPAVRGRSLRNPCGSLPRWDR